MTPYPIIPRFFGTGEFQRVEKAYFLTASNIRPPAGGRIFFLPFFCPRCSNYLFSIIRPGMKMKDVDATVRRYNAQLLADAGVMSTAEEVGTYMWHGGAHHIGYDVHDAIEEIEAVMATKK